MFSDRGRDERDRRADVHQLNVWYAPNSVIELNLRSPESSHASAANRSCGRSKRRWLASGRDLGWGLDDDAADAVQKGRPYVFFLKRRASLRIEPRSKPTSDFISRIWCSDTPDSRASSLTISGFRPGLFFRHHIVPDVGPRMR